MAFDIPWLLQTCIAGFIGAIITLLMPRIGRRISNYWELIPRALQRWRRKYFRWFIQRAQAIDRDPMLLQLEINRSGVYLALFWVCVLVWIFMSATLFVLVPAARDWPNLTIGLCTLPMYAFEFAWLLKSTQVDNVFKRRKRRAERGLTIFH